MDSSDLMDTFPQPSALPLVPFALRVALASFPPILALSFSSKEIQDAHSAPVLALLRSAQVAGKCPCTSHRAQGAPRAVSPPAGDIPRDTAPSMAEVTYGPEVTMTLRTRSKPRSARFRHSVVNSICLPWKFSWSKTTIWGCKERVG